MMDGAAFAATYEQLRPAVHRYAARRTRHPHDVEDVVSETFLRAWRHRASFADRGQGPLPWLYTIARNIILDAARLRREAHRDATLPLDDIAARTAAAPDDVLADVIARVDAEQLRLAMAELTRGQRDVIENELTGAATGSEFAEARGIPRGTYGQRKYRAIRALRQRLAEAS